MSYFVSIIIGQVAATLIFLGTLSFSIGTPPEEQIQKCMDASLYSREECIVELSR